MSIIFRDFGTAYLAAPLSAGAVSLTIDNPAWLPALQAGDYFYLVLQKYADRSYVEIVKVTATAGAVCTILRAQSGTAARSFAVGDYAELRLTTDSLVEFIAQNIATKMDKSGGGDFVGNYRFLNVNAPRVDLGRTSDNVITSILMDFSAVEGHRTIIGGAAGANAATPSILLRPNGYDNDTGQLRVGEDGLVDVVSCVMRGGQRTEAGAAVRYDELAKYTPATRSINGHVLSSDFDITADEVFKAGATVKANARFDASDFQYRDAAGAYGMRLSAVSTAVLLQAGKTDNTLTDQQLFLSGWAGHPLSSFKVYSEAPLVRRRGSSDYSVFDKDNKPVIDDVVGLSEALVQAGGKPVLSADWVQLRSAMWNGFVAADGQTLNRADYPDAWAAIAAGKVPVVADADWLADPLKRGSFTTGNGTTTFRVPDYNGKSVGSLGALFMRGDGTNSAVTNGLLQGDAIRNITGHLHSSLYLDQYNIVYPSDVNPKGAFTVMVDDGLDTSLNPVAGTSRPAKAVRFDASAVVPTAAENRPVAVTGCWAVKLFGAVQNAGSIDAAGLATQVAAVEARVSLLEQRKATCLVNAAGTGAPHETVVGQLPVNVVKGARYVIPNPFGNTPVACIAEVKRANGRWAPAGWLFVHNVGSTGVEASYVQGEGIVIQTGSTGVAGHDAFTGGGSGSDTGGASLDSMPCRVFVQRIYD